MRACIKIKHSIFSPFIKYHVHLLYLEDQKIWNIVEQARAILESHAKLKIEEDA